MYLSSNTQTCVFVFVTCRTLNMFGKSLSLTASIPVTQTSSWVKKKLFFSVKRDDLKLKCHESEVFGLSDAVIFDSV